MHSDEMAGRRAVTVQLLSGPREAMIQVSSSLYITSFSKCGVFLQSLFTYKVNPNKKSDVVIYQLHKFTGKFESVVFPAQHLLNTCYRLISNKSELR